MSDFKTTWQMWDSAWEHNVPMPKRIELLKKCTGPDFTYTNPNFSITGDLEGLAQYVEKALEAMGSSAKLKHLQWMENNRRSALHWDIDDMSTSQATLNGWSYGQYGTDGKLTCVADFW